MISVGLACWMIVGCGKNFNIVTFLDTVNVIKVRFCMIALLIELYLFFLSVTLTIFHSYKSVRQLQPKILCSYT